MSNDAVTDKQKIITRLGMLKAERATWWPQWQEITAYLLPRNGRYFRQDHNKGWKRHQSIYDNTATRALRVLAGGLMGGLTSPARPWFRLTTFDPDLAENAAVKAWLSQCTNRMMDVFARSNTYRALHSYYKELGGFGTSAAFLEDSYDNVIHHSPITTGEYCIATDWEGKVCTLYREFEKPVAEVVKAFGIDKVSTSTRNLFERGQLDSWVPLVHAIEPRADRDLTKRDAKNMAWRSVYYELNGNNEPLRESGYKEFPGLCPRWEVAGGDIYGNSPGMECLGDVKQLQQEQLRKSQGIDYMTNPPLQVPTGLKNRDVDRLPGGVTFYDPTSPSAGIKTMFEVSLDLNHLLADMQDVRERINSTFYADLFLMLANDANPGRMTATEVAERHEEKLLMLGPVLERLHNELLDPLISRTFARMLEAGMVPPPPPELHGQDVNVELVSMLAQAQRAIATNGIDRFVGALGQIATTQASLGISDTVADKFNADEWADKYSDVLGVDPSLIVPSDKVALIRRQRQQAQQQAQQAAAANQQADTAQKLGNTPTQNGSSNALQDVTQMFSGYGNT